MTNTLQRTYAVVDHWRRYQRYLPAAIRLTPEREPSEAWWSWRGAQIHLDRYAAANAPLTVIVLHGGGGNGRLMCPYAALLHSHGYEVVCPDLPGYGLSQFSAEMFSYASWVDCAADLVVAEVQRTGRPVALFGLSLGGYLGYMAAAKSRQVAGVIATTLCDPRLPIVRDQFSRSPTLNRLLSPLLPLAVAVCGGLRVPVRWFCNMAGVTNDPDLLRELCSDPVGAGNHVPLRFLNSIFSVRPAIEPEDFDLCPVLLAHPAADRWTTIEASQPFFDRIRGPKELVMLDNCGHLPIEEPGWSQLEAAVVQFLARLQPSKVG